MIRPTRALAAILSATVLALGACGEPSRTLGDLEQNQSGLDDVNRADPGGLREGGELRWPIDQMPENWNYNQATGTTVEAYRVAAATMPRLFLVQPDATVTVNKDYLNSAEITSTDPQVVTYHINPSAKWNDGKALSWEDFEAQVKALSGAVAGYQASSTTGYEDIAAVTKGSDDREVKVTFARKFADWKTLFSPLYPKAINASADTFNKTLSEKPGVSAGPFKVDAIDRTGKLFTLVPDTTWWGAKPRLAKITFRQVDRPALADALANGAIDFYEIGANVDLYERARTTPNVVVRLAAAPDYSHLTLNGAAGSVLADARMRGAILQGIDVKTITTAMLRRILKAEPDVIGNHMYLPGNRNYRDNSSIARFDKQAAESTLDSLGWRLDGEYRVKDGKQLALRFVHPTPSATNEETAKLVQSQLKAIGVKVMLNAVPSTEFMNKHVFTGDFDITGFRWLVSPFPLSSKKSVYYLDAGAVRQNYGRIGNDSINELFTAAAAELNEDERARLTNQIDEKLWQEGHHLPLYQLPGAVAVRKDLANFGAFGYGDIDWTRIGFAS